jgi:SAM-dependent methyltransferase
MANEYTHLAMLYDEWQTAVDSSAWADHVIRLQERYSRRGVGGDGEGGRPILLDLGCGTGSFCLAMADRGYDPIGIDWSAAMLDRVRQKTQAREDRPSILFIQQDISRFELYGTVDLIVCLLDTVNHLIRPAEVQKLFRLCANYLNPGAVLIFDLATQHHLATTLGNRLFFEDQESHALFWQNKYNRKSKISTAELVLFTLRPDGTYDRYDEIIRERLYDYQQIHPWLLEAGLEPVGHHGGLSMKKPASTDERHFVVARRPLA